MGTSKKLSCYRPRPHRYTRPQIQANGCLCHQVCILFFFLKKKIQSFNKKKFNLILAVAAPPLPPKPKKSDRPQRQPNASPPPPLPPRLPPRATPTRGVLESRSPHMDPVDPRREHNLMMQQMNSHSNPLPLGPRRHSNVVNGSGKSRNNFVKSTQPLTLPIIEL